MIRISECKSVETYPRGANRIALASLARALILSYVLIVSPGSRRDRLCLQRTAILAFPECGVGDA